MLESIKSPQELHNMDYRQLNFLAQEIRDNIIATVGENGGHLGANLGVVELTIALHSVLNSPTDKIVWDVGHQCYPHKLLTGRYSEFKTLRKNNGISGFPRPDESEHDSFGVGHSSTSISAAAGMAVARDLQQKDHSVVAVIGDGALTGGMALEALNHVGQLETDIVVILNDNAMSIAGNVGALSEYLNRLRLDPTLFRVRADLEAFIKRIPAIGESMSKLGSSMKDAVKSLLPGQLFEELGFSYFGPFDGHNISLMQKAIHDGIKRRGPVLIHVLTRKGKGYAPAEANPTKYHGVGPKVMIECELPTVTHDSYSSIFGRKLVDLAANEPKIVAITAAMQDGTGLNTFANTYPDRFFDVGIAEQHALTFGAGLAKQGMKPVVAIYSSFLQRGYDQIIHDIAMQNLPVVIAIDRAGVVGDDGPTHQGIYDISLLRNIPNLTILSPKNGIELKAMLDWALHNSGPTAIRYPKGLTESYGNLAFTEKQIPAELLRPGQDCMIFAIGNMVEPALQAAEILRGDLECGVLNIRSLKPLHKQLLHTWADKTKCIFTVEDHVVTGGFGSSIAEMFSASDARVYSFGYPDHPIEQASIAQLHEYYGLTAQGIAEQIKSKYYSLQRQPVLVKGDYQ